MSAANRADARTGATSGGGREDRSRRAVAPALVALLVALSGCTGEGAPAQTNAIVPGVLAGVVTDAALVAIADANVSVEGTDLTARTDASGAFRIELLPGEYVVLASHADHKTGALRASVLSAQEATLAFQLDAIPRIVPRVDVAEANGYLACGALVATSGERRALACGERDPNERAAVELPLGPLDGLHAVVVELAWTARTDAARVLRLELELRQGADVVALGATEGASPVTVSVPARLLGPGILVARAAPTGSFADEEAGADAGLVLQQPFTVYASSFYHDDPPAGYTARAG